MVTKALIPSAGLGSRFLPATKVIPKELLTILDKPAVHYIVKEALQANIKQFTIIGNSSKHAIEDYFSSHTAFTQQLSAQKKSRVLLSDIDSLIKSSTFTYVTQNEPLGLGHAIWCARHLIGKEQFAIMLPDDIIWHNVSCIGQMAKIAQQEKCNVIAVREVSPQHISSYGTIAIKKQFSPNLFQIREVVEKPSRESAPSNLAIVGRYVLSSHIFDALEESQAASQGEIQLTDAIQQLIFAGEKVFALKIQGDHYDIGNPLGLIKANIFAALKDPNMSHEMMAYLSEIDKEMLIIQGKAEALSRI